MHTVKCTHGDVTTSDKMQLLCFWDRITESAIYIHRLQTIRNSQQRKCPHTRHQHIRNYTGSRHHMQFIIRYLAKPLRLFKQKWRLLCKGEEILFSKYFPSLWKNSLGLAGEHNVLSSEYKCYTVLLVKLLSLFLFHLDGRVYLNETEIVKCCLPHDKRGPEPEWAWLLSDWWTNSSGPFPNPASFLGAHKHTNTHTHSQIPLCVWTNRGWKARQRGEEPI